MSFGPIPLTMCGMHFDLVDAVIELSPERIVTVKNVSAAEEYLQDHFPTFPVLPGVLMIESMVQAARRLLIARDPALGRHVLGGVRALKYGSFVRPGQALRVTVTLDDDSEAPAFHFKGSGEVVTTGVSAGAPVNAVAGRFTLRPPAL
ncbi:MAG TPA: hypothetical protein VG797_04690 [Phycisphaerales bacterium]|nr:hypothetical protein [Phycisphaerales bacterium]